MERCYSVRTLNYALIMSTAFIVSLTTFAQNTQALTASHGRPYHGRLENGVPFPNCFPGYQLREEGKTYTTPEVVGALLDAVEAVRTEFPDTCDLYIGDFSMTSGGSANHHRSHQNGRDVDIGMYAKGNRRLDGFMAMNEDNLDAAKTWCLIDNIIRSQRVQYIFLDRRIQQVLYNYAVTKGYDHAYLDRVFGNVRGSLIQHVRNHYDHIHVRFFTPWSTLAAHIGDGETEKRMVIEMAQQSYLPKKVNYYVNANDKSLDALAQSFGVTKRDLCKWNRLNSSAVPVPGSCLVFFKRSFESEPVHLARSLQPGYIAARAPAVRMASLQSEEPLQSVRDTAAIADDEPRVQEKRVERTETPASSSRSAVYTVRRGDTVKSVARRNNMEVKVLCSLNGIKETTSLKPGRTLKVQGSQVLADAGQTAVDAPRKSSSSSSAICFSSDSRKPNSPTSAYYTVGKGDTLQKISRKSGISIDVLCQLNGLKRGAGLKPGQTIKLTQANLPVKPSFGSSACAKPSVAGKASAAKGTAVQKAKGTRNGTAASAGSKSAVKAAQSKPEKKSAKQAVAVSKSAQKTKGEVKATSRNSSRKSVEAKKSGKAAPAEAKKKGGTSQSASVKPAQKSSAHPVNLAKNSTVGR